MSMHEDKRIAGERRHDEMQYRQDIFRHISAIEAEQQHIRSSTHSTELSLSKIEARLEERCPRHNERLSEIVTEIAKQDAEVWKELAQRDAKHKEREADTKARMDSMDQRINVVEKFLQKVIGIVIATGFFASLISSFITAWAIRKL